MLEPQEPWSHIGADTSSAFCCSFKVGGGIQSSLCSLVFFIRKSSTLENQNLFQMDSAAGVLVWRLNQCRETAGNLECIFQAWPSEDLYISCGWTASLNVQTISVQQISPLALLWHLLQIRTASTVPKWWGTGELSDLKNSLIPVSKSYPFVGKYACTSQAVFQESVGRGSIHVLWSNTPLPHLWNAIICTQALGNWTVLH